LGTEFSWENDGSSSNFVNSVFPQLSGLNEDGDLSSNQSQTKEPPAIALRRQSRPKMKRKYEMKEGKYKLSQMERLHSNRN
jgi:hypothetical protein